MAIQKIEALLFSTPSYFMEI